MPWKLIIFVICIVIVTIFIGFNLENACAVSIIFHTFEKVPVFITVLVSFAIGILVMLPFTFKIRSNNKKSSTITTKPTSSQNTGSGPMIKQKGTPVSKSTVTSTNQTSTTANSSLNNKTDSASSNGVEKN